MASGTMISFAAAQAMADALTAQLDAGSLGAVIEVRTGTPPANVEAASTGTLLASLTCSATFAPTAADQNPGARITANSITSDTSANATGEAGYFVCGSSSVADTIATKVIMGTAGVSGDTPDLTFDDDMIVTGGTVAITAWTIDMPES